MSCLGQCDPQPAQAKFHENVRRIVFRASAVRVCVCACAPVRVGVFVCMLMRMFVCTRALVCVCVFFAHTPPILANKINKLVLT